jgi:SPP1 gp7 family putative phage head morphogenesis protein
MIAANFNLVPQEALAFFRNKGLEARFDWRDMLHEEHDVGFTVAKMLDLDMLAEVKDAVDQAIAEGKSLQWFKDQLKPMLIQRGWWGRQEMTDPATGEVREVQLGSSRRLKIIYDTNLRTSYAAGHWAKVVKNAKSAPYLMYVAVDDGRTRPTHRAWDGMVLRWNDPWWDTHYPPNGWNCRCIVIQLSERDLKRMGKSGPDTAPPIDTREWENPRTGEVFQVPKGIDPGWGYHAGKGGLKQASDLFVGKMAAAPADLGAAAFASMEKQIVPELEREFAAWVKTVAGEMAPKGERHVIGALTPAVVSYLSKARNAAPQSAAIAIDDAKLSHLVRDAKSNAGKSVPLEYVQRLPELLADPAAILWDEEKQTLLYVFNVVEDAKGRTGKIVVAVDYVRKTRQPGGTREIVTENRVISGGLVQAVNLKESRYVLISGGAL